MSQFQHMKTSKLYAVYILEGSFLYFLVIFLRVSNHVNLEEKNKTSTHFPF